MGQRDLEAMGMGAEQGLLSVSPQLGRFSAAAAWGMALY